MKLSFSPIREMNKIFHSLDYISREEEREVRAKNNLLSVNSETSAKESFYPNVKKKNLLFTFR